MLKLPNHTQSPTKMTDFQTYTNPTLISIQEQDLLNPVPLSVACRYFPAAQWMVAQNIVRVYCRVMHVLVWAPDETDVPSICEG